MKKSRKVKQPVDRRQLILDAAIRLFTRQGVIGTTFREIAKEAGVHQPLIGYYFPTFNDLFKAVVEIILDDIKKASVEPLERPSADLREALHEYLRAPIVWRKRRPEFSSLWTFFYHLASYQPLFLQMNDVIRTTGRERISLLLYKFQEHYKFRLRNGWTIDQLAHAVQVQITGAAIHSVTESGEAEGMAELCEQAVNAILDSAFEA